MKINSIIEPEIKGRHVILLSVNSFINLFLSSDDLQITGIAKLEVYDPIFVTGNQIFPSSLDL